MRSSSLALALALLVATPSVAHADLARERDQQAERSDRSGGKAKSQRNDRGKRSEARSERREPASRSEPRGQPQGRAEYRRDRVEGRAERRQDNVEGRATRRQDSASPAERRREGRIDRAQRRLEDSRGLDARGVRQPTGEGGPLYERVRNIQQERDREARRDDRRDGDRDGYRDGRRDGRHDGYRDGRRDGRWNGYRDGRRDGYRDGRRDRHREWSHHWRNDHRYNWHDYRRKHRSLFRLGFYYDPFGWSYRRYDIGYRLRSAYYRDIFWISDPWRYRLPPAYGPYRWVRYYDDALLVDIYSGQVVDVIYSFFW